jgi:hypothetical protein
MTMNTFDWVVTGISVTVLAFWLLLKWALSGKDSLR